MKWLDQDRKTRKQNQKVQGSRIAYVVISYGVFSCTCSGKELGLFGLERK
jgi:hypothetical protein